MATNGEIEGTPAEATWAMLTVLIILVVVLIFCCLLPFYKALEKRWHHWDDLANDPRWDVENFQFSPTSPRLSREPKYNRLSVSSTGNNSSINNSCSGISRGSSFRNQCMMPRFPDQVEFKLPPSYDELFSNTEVNEAPEIGNYNQASYEVEEETQDAVPAQPPPIRKTISSPAKTASNSTAKTVSKNNASPATKTAVKSSARPASKTEEKHSESTEPVHTKKATTVAAKPAAARQQIKQTSLEQQQPTERLSAPARKTVVKPSSPVSTKQITKTPTTTQKNTEAASAAPVPPAKKTYKKIKKTPPGSDTPKQD